MEGKFSRKKIPCIKTCDLRLFVRETRFLNRGCLLYLVTYHYVSFIDSSSPGSLSSSSFTSPSSHSQSSYSEVPGLSSQDTIPYTVEEDDSRQKNINNLQEMFPNTARSVILQAIQQTNSFDEGVDFVINYNKGRK